MNRESNSQETNINMINFTYTFIKHPSLDNLSNLQSRLYMFPKPEFEETIKNKAICVIGEKNVGKSLLISRLAILKSYKKRVLTSREGDDFGVLFYELSWKADLTPSIIYMMDILIFVAEDLSFGEDFLDGMTRSIMGLMNYGIKEKDIFIFVNKRSSDKSLKDKFKLFQHQNVDFFVKLKLGKPVKIIYKDFKNIHSQKSLDMLKKLLGINCELFLSTSSFYSDTRSVSGQTGKNEKKNSISGKKDKNSTGKGKKSGCAIF